jgi:hypothetical protein
MTLVADRQGLGCEPINQSGRWTSALVHIPDSSRTLRHFRNVPSRILQQTRSNASVRSAIVAEQREGRLYNERKTDFDIRGHFHRGCVMGAVVDCRGVRSLCDAGRAGLVCLCRQFCRRGNSPSRANPACYPLLTGVKLGHCPTFETCRLHWAMSAFRVTRKTFAHTEFFSV